MNEKLTAEPHTNVHSDTARIDWLSQPGRWVHRPEEEAVLSYHTTHKEIAHYIDGRYTLTFGKSLREAVDAAMGISGPARCGGREYCPHCDNCPEDKPQPGEGRLDVCRYAEDRRRN